MNRDEDNPRLSDRLKIEDWLDRFEQAFANNPQLDVQAFLQQVEPKFQSHIEKEIEKIVLKTSEISEADAAGTRVFDDSQSISEVEFDNYGTIGQSIGPYKLLQKIGEGGMGTVFMAQQDEPVQRQVALKIIKLGLETKEVIARFEAERQALSLMDHPNIARVLDVGTTETGRPFFVMELVRGLPITRYCDERKLSLQQRLKLFRSICSGVHHAHQRGIIHRDLKPSNILIAEYDHEVVPKIIDFGLAKAMNRRLTDKTMFTQLGQVVGTFAYMSPEQSKMNQLDVDTRTDIYSLGVILYELITGTTPFERKRLRSEAIDQVLKIIREEDPPAPSLRLSTVDSMPEVAACRQIKPDRFRGTVRGELDWIVMKALDKERARRYDSASNFGLDVERYLNGDPVDAAPPSYTYRIRKFVRRNKAAVITSTLVLLALIIGFIGTAIGLVQANNARNDSIAAQKKSEERRQRTREALELMSGTMLEEWLLSQDEVKPQHREFLRKILEYYIDFANDSTENFETSLLVAAAHLRVGDINDLLGESEKALEAYTQSQSILSNLSPNSDQLLECESLHARTLQKIGILHKRTGNRPSALKFFAKARQLIDELSRNHPESVALQAERIHLGYLVARVHMANQDYGKAIPMFDDQIAQLRKLKTGADDRSIDYKLSQTLQNLALCYRREKRQKDAIASYEEGISILESLLKVNPDNKQYRWQLSVLINDLGVLHKHEKRYEIAEEFYERAMLIRRGLFAENPNSTEFATLLSGSYLNLGNLCRILKRGNKASQHYHQGISISEKILARDPQDVRPRIFARNMYEGLAEEQILKEDFESSLKSWEASIAHNSPEFSLGNPFFDARLPLRRAYVLAKLDRIATAISLTDRILSESEDQVLGEARYCAASVYTAAYEEEMDVQKRKQYALTAIELLGKSIEDNEAYSGPKGTDWTNDPEFDSIRDHPEFAKLDDIEPKK